MSLSMITAAEQFAKAIKQVEHAINYFNEQDMFMEVMNATKKGIVRLQSEDEDFEILVSTRADMLESSVDHNIIWGNTDCDNDLLDALFWIQGSIDGDPTTFVVGGFIASSNFVN